jgi:GNAT superfamily N-acetyltransferase
LLNEPGKVLLPASLLLTWQIKIKIRQADLGDAKVLADFNLRLAEETESLHLSPAVVEEGVAALLKDSSKGIYFVAEVDGTIIGQVMITYEWSDWRNGNIWWLQSVYVRHESRRQGVLRRLFEHLRTLAQAQPDVCGLRLYMHAENHRARKSYERLGLNETAYQVLELDFSGSFKTGPSGSIE